ncbi:uncharacterized protein FOMMEDRAFT_95249 [Fomitiporia mediterranea MF3/22]|uniref:uncharacterized protein n=1 Tax=Fomitiporia mediterranea (strain MF3/22) TaxID=694068 RepID=UPI0004409241|nr:uncharacterized protein FOMMEDRAFT_95249 [Fomitiporia mediterranea MF3/22]EJC98966.1 hypothetical protein FOMMEDRAFT_95249 [Fomitiporia mediterranea MF3/22]
MEYSVNLELICRVLHKVARRHWNHFEQSGERKELDASIFHDRIALGLRPKGHPDRFEIVENLGTSLSTRYVGWGELKDLEGAIELHRAALDLCPEGHPYRSEAMEDLGSSLSKRFEYVGKIEDLEEAVMLHRAALRLRPRGHPERSRTVNNLGSSLFIRFRRWGKLEDLEEAITLYREALYLHPKGHPYHTASLNNIASSLATRFEHCKQTEDLDEAVKLHYEALVLCPEGHPDRSMSLSNLAVTLNTRFDQHGRLEDLNKAIALHRAAIRPKDHPDHFSSLDSLASSLLVQFKHYGRKEDLSESIELFFTALDRCPQGHPRYSALLVHLGESLVTRFKECGQTEDLNEAIKFHRAALELRPNGHPDCPSSLNHLATALKIRFEQHGRVEDLDEAIDLHNSAVELCPKGHPLRPNSLSYLANSLQTRFEQYGRNEDSDRVIELHRATLELCPEDHTSRPAVLNDFANSLRSRFRQHGRTEYLEAAIELHNSAVELCPQSHHDRPSYLNNLANALFTRYEQHGQTEDIDRAIELHRAALVLLPEGRSNRSMSLLNLANSLHTRYKNHGRTEDLDEAISLNYAALELCPQGHQDRFMSLNNLANAVGRRYDRHGRREDLNKALELHSTALELVPEGHADHSSSLMNLTYPLSVRFVKFGCTDDLEVCMRLLERATKHKFSSSVVRLDSASRWADLARAFAHSSTSRAYEMAMSLLQRTLIVSPTLHSQHDFLKGKSNYKTLSLEAVAYAVEGNRLEEAIEILEQGRALLWSQMRGFRTALDQLMETNRELAERFRGVSHQLESLATSSEESMSSSKVGNNGSLGSGVHTVQQSFDDMLKLKRQLSNEQEEIIKKIRRLPGFESFLAATPFKVLRQAASEGPVVVINHCKYRCDALIMLPREDIPLVCIPLDANFYKDSSNLCKELLETRTLYGADSTQYDDTLRRVMKMLWDRVVFKIVSKLEELGIAEGSRIWWCPTSVLSALPFHAAGPFKDKDGSARYLLDKYASSYTPTLGALIDARSGGHEGEPTVLIIGDASLSSARREISNIRNCGIDTKMRVSDPSRGAVVTRNTVIKALRKATWVHFVCHGNLNPKPFDSSFKLSDGGLTLLDIVQGNIPNAEFAFLSACHTAEQPHDAVHDEVLHLAAAMQFSGFRSVIGSMWELLDEDGPFLARNIYEYIWDCGEGEARYKRAAAGLRKAAVELKAQLDVQVERWVNLVHIGA